MNTRILAALAALPLCLPALAQQAAAPAPAAIRAYPIHADGGLVYTPLSDEARRTGALARYDWAPRRTVVAKLGGCTLTAAVPVAARPYDVVPIPYTLSWQGEPAFPLAAEAVAFEDEARRKGRDLFDLALPGRLDLKVKYLGSITGHMKPGGRHNLKADNSDKPGVYPPFTRSPMVRSGVVEAGDILWFRFRVTNTGDTILDPEGFGGWGLYPELQRRKGDKYEYYSHHYNLYIRDKQALYPGESRDFWVNFTSDRTTDSYRIEPGDYRIDFRSYFRFYRDWNDWVNMWEGAWMTLAQMPITVADQPRQAPVEPLKVTMTDAGVPNKLTRYIHTFQEFMTTFDAWQKPPASGRRSVQGTLYLQVAPWTRHVVLKLVAAGPVRCKTVAVPILLAGGLPTLKPNLHAANCMVEKGRRVPAVYSQLMSDMRANIQTSPTPETQIIADIRRMKECGINVCATTAMPWLYADAGSPRENHPGDAMKYSLDVARREGMKLEAWGSYPYDRSTVADIYNWVTGSSLKMNTYMTNGYPAVSHAEPAIARANAAIWLYQFRRWGDGYAQFENGAIPFGTEDTRGWMRQDVHTRFPLGDLTKGAFRTWLRDRYRTVERMNTAWGSRFEDFDSVDPEAGAAVNMFGHRFEYLNAANLFHDWSPAMADYDAFRTWMRCKNYAESRDIIRKVVPQAAMFLRTEGANAIVEGLSPADPNPHYRHAYYSQRRVAAEAEMVRKSGAFAYHSDYITLPYTPSEVRKLTAMGVKQGIVPAWLPQFDNMRDIAVNEKYGTDYTVNFNADRPVKGAMMHVLTAVYPWFQAVSEAGGIPGILWDDLQCDGFATETQQRELLLFKAAMARYLSSPAGRKAAATGVRKPDRSWLKQVTPKACYTLPRG